LVESALTVYVLLAVSVALTTPANEDAVEVVKVADTTIAAPASTPAGGTVTDCAVPVVVYVAVPIDLMKVMSAAATGTAIAAVANPAAISNRRSTHAPAQRAGVEVDWRAENVPASVSLLGVSMCIVRVLP
jgi:hypothetical protein